MNSLHPYFVAAARTLADPWKVGAAIGVAYILGAGSTVGVRGRVSAVDGFKILTPPLGAWLILPVAMTLFPILACASIVLTVYLLTQLLSQHSLTLAEWMQLFVFLVSLPLYICCPISLFRWCFVRWRYNETGFEWGLFRVTHGIKWSDVVSFRAGELRGLEFRLHNGPKVKMPVYLNGLTELSEAVGDWIAVDTA